MSKSFNEGIKTPFAGAVKVLEVNTKEGPKEFDYLSWALALAFADRPRQETIWRDNAIGMEVFGGIVVGVRQFLPDGREQATWLPVLNGANQAMPAARVTSRDMSDTLNRCRAKAIAMVNGVGLPLYANGERDVVAFLKKLGVKPDSDLSRVDPVISSSPKKNGTFIDWTHALAAARITDPNFQWEVCFHEVVDASTGEVAQRPYFHLGTGWGVDVRVCYKGEEHTEVLPIMGFVEVQTKNGLKMLDHQPLLNPNCHDWNRSVMRCLTKAISMRSGYGINMYAKAEVDDMHVDPLQRREAAPTDAASQAETANGPAPMDDPGEKAALVDKVAAALSANQRQASGLLEWLGHKDTDDLSVASVVELERALKALSPPQAATSAPRAASKLPQHRSAAAAGPAFL